MKKLIVGLGNPDEKYKNTRHNVGFTIVDALVEPFDIRWKTDKKFNAAVAEVNEYILMKPMTYMNLSGKAVSAAAKYYKISDDNIIVIHDDADIAEGSMKFEKGRGAAGHNGVADIIKHLKTKDFWRARVGISRPDNPSIELEDWVLMDYTEDEEEHLRDLIPEIEKKISEL